MAPTASLTRPTGPRQRIGAAVLLFGTAATVGTALLFEHVGGYIPCALCLEQRTPYYLSIVLAALALGASLAKAPAALTRGLVLIIGLAMLYGLALAIFHSGVEWKFWPGPAECGAGGGVDLTGDLLATIDGIRPPACDQAAGRFLGLSFAGWNVLASALFAAIALKVALGRADRTA